MLKTANNVDAYRAIVAVGRCYMGMTGFEIGKAKDCALRMDAVCENVRVIEVVVALVILLLKALGAPTPGDDSRFRVS